MTPDDKDARWMNTCTHHTDKQRAAAMRCPVCMDVKIRELEDENSALRSSANFHRDLGITTMDAKWLDPECHKGCQSLVYRHRITALESERDNWRVSSVCREKQARVEALEAEVVELRQAVLYCESWFNGQLQQLNNHPVAIIQAALAKTAADYAGKCVVPEAELKRLYDLQFKYLLVECPTDCSVRSIAIPAAELDALRKDRERIDWLDEQRIEGVTMAQPRWYWKLSGGKPVSENGEQCRSVRGSIDAAMAKKEGA